MSEMDAVDSGQQREIEELKSVNARQDSYLKNVIWAFVVFGVIQFSSMVMFLQQFGVNGLGLCPHKDCPHHVVK